ncbi:SAM-dependent methyltransferase [Nocardiopsis sp. EMB25]|uniref:SAM-dependent methyltransferase n=1 Tax=Nocardiopsis TaxID=2013 RepID=UPI00047606C7|nr:MULTISPECIES: SAM-dependent methyltransferase [Nocardiopsis]MCY9782871.1 SAM-dependent methyltransferase [Nocardiopsis sp. EMB25]
MIVTDVRGSKAGPLTAASQRPDPVPLPGRQPGVVGLGRRAQTWLPDPRAADHLRRHERFLGRIIDYLCADAGVDQFVDWGCAVPGTGTRVRERRPGAAVVHVAPYGTAGVLSSSDTAVLSGDGADPTTLLHRLRTSGHVDLDRPLAVLLTRPLTADTSPTWIDGLHSLMRGGGYLALTSSAPPADTESAFAPFRLLEPGVADITWWPYPDEEVSAEGSGVLGGLGRARTRTRGSSRWL